MQPGPIRRGMRNGGRALDDDGKDRAGGAARVAVEHVADDGAVGVGQRRAHDDRVAVVDVVAAEAADLDDLEPLGDVGARAVDVVVVLAGVVAREAPLGQGAAVEDGRLRGALGVGGRRHVDALQGEDASIGEVGLGDARERLVRVGLVDVAVGRRRHIVEANRAGVVDLRVGGRSQRQEGHDDQSGERCER